jgi:hypothetical protein
MELIIHGDSGCRERNIRAPVELLILKAIILNFKLSGLLRLQLIGVAVQITASLLSTAYIVVYTW